MINMAGDLQVRVLYDFEGQPGSGELTITVNETLTVLRQDVGEGWWEGSNSKGERGLFPAGYVEIISSSSSPPPPSVPPPPLPSGFTGGGGQVLQPQALPTTNEDPNDDWDDDDWDDDDSNYGGQESSLNTHQNASGPHSSADMHVLSLKSGKDSNATQSGKSTVGRTFNRFSMFVKSGGESFILGETKINVPSDSYITILDNNGEIFWEPNESPYTCEVASPKMESKLKGLKRFIAYQITFNNRSVSRRYKHFDWLHGRLEEKYSLIPVPPLPDKQISGRYQDNFIEHRMAQLQMWVNRICRHPVFSRSPVWLHFITCIDEKAWKQGKRKAEKDELVGASFCHAIQAPEAPLQIVTTEKQVENFSKFVVKIDECVRHMFDVSQEQTKRFQRAYKGEFLKVAASLRTLGDVFETEPSVYSPDLPKCIKNTGETYEKIAKLYEEQPKNDFMPMGDVLHEYKGMLSSWPDILQLHKGALNKKREFQKLGDENKVSSETQAAVIQRTDIISYATLAEINQFQRERVVDFKQMMQVFLSEQISFYQRIVKELQDALVHLRINKQSGISSASRKNSRTPSLEQSLTMSRGSIPVSTKEFRCPANCGLQTISLTGCRSIIGMLGKN